MPINLHIFEERYKQMINLCIDKRQPFGIVLIETGTAELSAEDARPAEPYPIGCTAQITQVQRLSQGRMNITAIGRERFRIMTLSHDLPYLTGQVELIPLYQNDAESLIKGGNHLRHWVDRYLGILERAGQVQFNSRQLPREPLSLAYLASMLLQGISLTQKQQLLEARDAVTMLRDLRTIYRREVALLDALLTPPENSEGRGSFSPN
jgi:Lon protease-like protein